MTLFPFALTFYIGYYLVVFVIIHKLLLTCFVVIPIRCCCNIILHRFTPKNACVHTCALNLLHLVKRYAMIEGYEYDTSYTTVNLQHIGKETLAPIEIHISFFMTVHFVTNAHHTRVVSVTFFL